MTNRDEEIPSNHHDHDYVDDYDVDFMDVLMNLNDQMVDASNSDDSPFNDTTMMNLNNDGENIEGCYFVLGPKDIVCGGMPEEMSHHPGKALFETIVANFVLPYGLATRKSERQSLLSKIYSQIELACQSAGRGPLRYVVPASTSDESPCYQVASQHEIMEEIKFSIRTHFNLIPTSLDVLFGPGQSCQDFPGNVRLRTFIENQSGRYASAGPTDRQRIVQATRESVTAVGGRFLLPFDNSRPSDGCVEAPDYTIRRKIAHLYRGGPILRREVIEIAQALPLGFEPEVIICGGVPEEMSHHPGKVFFERVVANFVLPYGLATRASETQLLLAEIYSQIEMACQSAGRRPLRYVVPTVPSDGLPYYEEASQDEIMDEIKFSIRSHFNVIPTPNDVLFGRGQPCRDFPGNVRFRTFIDNQRGHYASAGPMDRERIIQETKESVTAVGGRFLLPFDNARPGDGCVEASHEAIKRKIAHLYRDNTSPRRSMEMAQAPPS